MNLRWGIKTWVICRSFPQNKVVRVQNFIIQERIDYSMLVNERDESLWLSTCVFYHSWGLCKENKVTDHEGWSESVLEDRGINTSSEDGVMYSDEIYHIRWFMYNLRESKIKENVWNELPIF